MCELTRVNIFYASEDLNCKHITYFVDPNECNYDAVIIIDGPRTSRYCGRRTPPEYTSTGNKISIGFKSDESFEIKGFNISFTSFAVETDRK